MIIVTERKRLEGVNTFDAYKRVIGYSNSFFKGKIKKNDGMMLGSLVDSILLEDGGDKTHPLYPQAIRIADRLRGEIPERAEKQVVYTARFNCHGYYLPVKGRIDMLLPDMVIDLKVLNSSRRELKSTIEHFGYPTAMSGYCMMSGCSNWCLLIYSIKDMKTYKIAGTVDMCEPYWINRIVKFGIKIL